MATPLLDFLTGRAKQALPILKGAAARGLSATAALALLVPEHLTFNRQRMLDVYAALQPAVAPERAFRLVGQNAPLPYELHNNPPQQMAHNFEYVVEAVDEFAEPLGYLTVSSAVPLAGNEVRARAVQLFESQPEEYLEDPLKQIGAISVVEANANRN
jgi:hypothetical protein